MNHRFSLNIVKYTLLPCLILRKRATNEDVLAGSFHRILTMAEQEQSARLQLDMQRHQDTASRDKQVLQAAAQFSMRELASRSKRELTGMWLGFSLAAGVLLIATLVIFTGRSLEAGIALIVGDAVAIAAVFVHQTRSSRGETTRPPED